MFGSTGGTETRVGLTPINSVTRIAGRLVDGKTLCQPSNRGGSNLSHRHGTLTPGGQTSSCNCVCAAVYRYEMEVLAELQGRSWYGKVMRLC
jgi:hypothetical protein